MSIDYVIFKDYVLVVQMVVPTGGYVITLTCAFVFVLYFAWSLQKMFLSDLRMILLSKARLIFIIYFD